MTMTMPQTAAPSSSPLTPELLERLHRAGLRVTPATRAVLGLFAADPCAARCHFEVLAQLQARGLLINRVTLYRLLDRLAACGVLLRHADAHERRWRFTWAGNGAAALAQPRFECDACHCLLPLPAAALEAQQLAQSWSERMTALGHQPQRLDFTLHGTCADCLQPHARP
ncbi:MAG: Fur family transcriptional regulator [Betaproteobacteria bacterium]|uniref:Fe2+/Zn2+ uptake regulation protein n=1 Tax=Serpentinimonas maccroryi TaxID=1458426 RepID=A0A060NV70_9BURK|nr:hypothetical protein [Serpentinimonas maccroryi]MCL5968643.1 Fur family transcriptional regulator [Betaproteobacteria bacterium]BAO82789.1 Fe2+/Zn2+ uptake regulation protein [Serpentinimonas maccroryi]